MSTNPFDADQDETNPFAESAPGYDNYQSLGADSTSTNPFEEPQNQQQQQPLRSQQPGNMQSVSQHVFQLHNYKRPTFCAHCGGLLVGVMRQGLRCKRCETDVHEKCQEDLQKGCIEMVVGQHNFREKTYKQPTFCDCCTKLLVGVVNQGFKCSECSANVHDKCREKIETECKKTPGKQSKKKTAAAPKDSNENSPPSSKDLSPAGRGMQRVRGSRRTFRGRGGNGRRERGEEKVPFATMKYLNEDSKENEDPEPSSVFATMPPKQAPSTPQHQHEELGRTPSDPAQPLAPSCDPSPSTSRNASSAQQQAGGSGGGSSNANLQQMDAAVQKVVDIMKDNSSKLNERCDKLENLQDKSQKLKESASIFEKKTIEIRRKMWLRNKKLWICLAAVLLVLIVIIVVSVVFVSKKKTA